METLRKRLRRLERGAQFRQWLPTNLNLTKSNPAPDRASRRLHLPADSLDVPATMSNPADMIDNIYLTIDGGRTFVQAAEVIRLTAHPGGAVAADGGVQPSDPVTDTGLIKFLRSALSARLRSSGIRCLV
jgi:hypothetical protein